jgi:hypothetical protein
MRYCKLRIAWSVGWGILCLLVIALWVRSYRWCDIVEGPFIGSSGFQLASQNGDVSCRKYRGSQAGWAISSIEMDVLRTRLGWSPSGFYWNFAIESFVQVPHWFLLCIVATLAAVSWLPWRFSLRTLLIAMSLIAAVLGAIAYTTL